MTVTPSSEAVAERGGAEMGCCMCFVRLAVISPPGCGSCIGNGPGSLYRAR